MSKEITKKMNDLIYKLTKDAARSSFADYLDDLSITEEEYAEIKKELAKIGITKTYL